MNQVFEIFADGRKAGIVTAESSAAALKSATRALSRFTASKDQGSCDYANVEVVLLGGQQNRAALDWSLPNGPVRQRFGRIKRVPATHQAAIAIVTRHIPNHPVLS